MGNPHTPPPPRPLGIREDGAGLLWVFGLVAAPTWREAWARVPAGMRDVPGTLIDRDLFHHLIVEVLDPVAGTLLARRRISGHPVSLPAGGSSVALYELDQDGEPLVRILSLSLVRPGRRP